MIDREAEAARVLDVAASLDEPSLLELAVRPEDAEVEEISRARHAASAAVDRAALRDGIERLQGEVARFASGTPWIPVAGADRPNRLLGDLRRQAAPAIFDAALAAYLGGALDSTSREALTRRWRRVTEPEDEDPGR